ncbi:hypothetical protein LEN26_010770 [Aphanomyces euteiches]|nr:hypothetical protein AeMF1_012244 [Aphanomyces euteiches]KAH9121192.1 hypothetical protein LEN26_010770 [Aphanomyces euteiches]KAH9164763.1 hypothetical protein AeNC1_018638 [Aphanomyces euteiches]
MTATPTVVYPPIHPSDITLRVLVRYPVPRGHSVSDVLHHFRSAEWIHTISKLVVPHLKSRVDPAFLAQLPSADHLIDDDAVREDCVICLHGMTRETTNVVLPCGHVFHSSCIAGWLHIRNECPHCRTLLASQYSGRYSFRLVATKLELTELRDLAIPDSALLDVAVGGKVLRALVDVILGPVVHDVGGPRMFSCEMKTGLTLLPIEPIPSDDAKYHP